MFQQAKLYHFCNGLCQKRKKFVDCFLNKTLRLAAVLEWLGEVVWGASGWGSLGSGMSHLVRSGVTGLFEGREGGREGGA